MYFRYRIRLPTEKELEMKVSKDVKKMRLYESTLLNTYKVGILFCAYLLNKMESATLKTLKGLYICVMDLFLG